MLMKLHEEKLYPLKEYFFKGGSIIRTQINWCLQGVYSCGGVIIN
jgi:hypothetical protein